MSSTPNIPHFGTEGGTTGHGTATAESVGSVGGGASPRLEVGAETTDVSEPGLPPVGAEGSHPRRLAGSGLGSETSGTPSVRLAYADPPYPGKAELYAEHPDYDGEVDHGELIERLQTYDGWALSTGSWALQDVLAMCPSGVRILVWTKHSIARSWEPVIVSPARDEAHARRLRDWIRVEPEYFQWRPKPDTYVIGQKPEPFCMWLFEWLGARADDTLDDLFPGSGAVGAAWEKWRARQPSLFAESVDTPATRTQRDSDPSDTLVGVSSGF